MSNAPKPRGNVVNYYEGDTITTISRDEGYWIGLSITNDDSIDLEFALNDIRITVKPNEIFEDDFVDFQSLTINTNTAYRLALKE